MPWRNVDPAIAAPIMAFVTALFRILYDRKETTLIRGVVEMVLCALLAVGAGAALRAAGVENPDWQTATGAVIGLMGVKFVRNIADRVVIGYTGPERRKR